MKSSIGSVLLLTLLVAAGNTQGKTVHVEVKWIESLRSSEVRPFDGLLRSAIPAAEGAAGTTELSPEAREVLSRSSRWFSTLFYDVRGAQVGARQLTHGGDDILVATWGPSSDHRGVRSTFMWDAPDVNVVVMEVDPSTVESPSILGELLASVIRPEPNLGVNKVNFVLLEDFRQEGVIGLGRVGYLRGPSAILKEFQFLVVAYRRATRTYIAFWGGKQLAGQVYSPGMISVPERFPPLSVRLPQWGTDSIIEQLGKGTRQRDELLLQELIQRGMTHQQFQAVMFLDPKSQPAMHSKKKAERIRTFLVLLARNDKAVEYDQQIQQALRAYERMGAEGMPLLGATLASLSWKQADYSEVVLDLLRKGLAIEEGLRYLSNAAYFVPPKKEQALALQRIQVPEKYRVNRNRVVQTMLANIPTRP